MKKPLLLLVLAFITALVSGYLKLLHDQNAETVLTIALSGIIAATLWLTIMSFFAKSNLHGSIKKPLIVLIFSFLGFLAGAYLKIFHLEGGNMLLTLGLIGKVVATLWLIVIAFLPKSTMPSRPVNQVEI
ncbi:MAG TPA: hypothetical protein VK666_08300 [Chryseolinea sp.]|nr:hypothetical protein [Chryseolinea sp.]